MLRKPLMLVTAAGAFVMVQGAALAQSNCGGSGGGGIWATYCSKKPAKKVKPAVKPNAEVAADADAATNNAADAATAVPAAPVAANASPAPAANANAAVVAGAGALGASALAGISTGQEVKTSAGAALGKVTQVVKGPDGSISQVIVTSAAGRSFPVAAGKISLSGGVLIVSDKSDQ